MNKDDFGRDDIRYFIDSFKEENAEEDELARLLTECGCYESEDSIYDNYDQVNDSSLVDIFDYSKDSLSAQAPCPETYNKSADLFVSMPSELINMLLPLMQELEVGCPASLCKAMADVLTVAQENGITSTFNTEDNEYY